MPNCTNHVDRCSLEPHCRVSYAKVILTVCLEMRDVFSKQPSLPAQCEGISSSLLRGQLQYAEENTI
jgi:hypothetical protein